MRRLKTFGWQGHRMQAPGLQTREICRASSMAAVARIAGVKSPRELFNLTETGNALEIAITSRDIGVIYWRPLDARDDDLWTRISVP